MVEAWDEGIGAWQAPRMTRDHDNNVRRGLTFRGAPIRTSAFCRADGEDAVADRHANGRSIACFDAARLHTGPRVVVARRPRQEDRNFPLGRS